MGTAPSNPPDPQIPPIQGENVSPLTQQADQQQQIDIIAAQDLTLPPIKGVLGGLPVAEKNQEYFAIIKEAGDTSPEIIGQTQFKVVYLCDSQLNVSKPTSDGIALANINQNFERQKYAEVRVDQGTVLNQQLSGLHKVTAVGSLEPIAGTQVGNGPLEYVTTMSFVQKGQLGAAPGITVETYYYWLNKTVGYENSTLAYVSSGTISSNLLPTGKSGGWSYSGVKTPSSIDDENQIITYYDSQQNITTGSAVTGSTISTPIFGQNSITILTSSIEGNTRIRVSAGVGINIVTSSVADLFASGQYGNQQGDKDDAYNYGRIIKLRVYKANGGDINDVELIDETQKSISTFNKSFTSEGVGYSFAGVTEIFRDLSNVSTLNGFSWAPNQVVFPSLVTDYFDVNENDKIFATIELPEESTSSLYPGDLGSIAYFTESLYFHRNAAAVRKYGYFGGHLIMNQETPEGQNFVNGVTGITASYFSESVQTVYNYTGSYWIGYNNFSSSTEGIGSYITASTPLTQFYGGEYIQVDPGTESYNTLYANGEVTASLGTGTNKKTWTSFGFNPIRLSFTPQAGDFIRFEYSPTKRFQITRVQSSGNVLKLKLDGQIPASTVLDNFIIYRIVENGQYIILDVEKNNEVSVDQIFTGIISPEYPSKELGEKADTLIFDLKQAGIIET